MILEHALELAVLAWVWEQQTVRDVQYVSALAWRMERASPVPFSDRHFKTLGRGRHAPSLSNNEKRTSVGRNHTSVMKSPNYLPNLLKQRKFPDVSLSGIFSGQELHGRLSEMSHVRTLGRRATLEVYPTERHNP